MIALPSIAFGGFSGSAKGVTARQVGGRSILSVKCWPTGVATGAQLVRRASLKKISKSWKELTSDQMRDWDRLAETATGQSVFCQAAQLSGMNLYVRLNANRAMEVSMRALRAFVRARFFRIWCVFRQVSEQYFRFRLSVVNALPQQGHVLVTGCISFTTFRRL